MSRTANFIRQPLYRKLLIAEALFRLYRASFVVRKVGFTKRAQYLGTKYPGDWSEGNPQNLATIRDIRWAINKARYMTGEKFTCLMIGLAGKEMMRRFEISNALVLGARNCNIRDKQEILAHAWLRAGEMVVFGEKEMEGMKPIVSYVDRFPLKN